MLLLMVLMRWMKLEPIIQSEVSQKEKHQYSILTHIKHTCGYQRQKWWRVGGGGRDKLGV